MFFGQNSLKNCPILLKLIKCKSNFSTTGKFLHNILRNLWLTYQAYGQGHCTGHLKIFIIFLKKIYWWKLITFAYFGEKCKKIPQVSWEINIFYQTIVTFNTFLAFLCFMNIFQMTYHILDIHSFGLHEPFMNSVNMQLERWIFEKGISTIFTFKTSKYFDTIITFKIFDFSMNVYNVFLHM